MADRRKHARWALHVPVKVRLLSGATPRATLIDLSIEGCRLQTSGIHASDRLILRIGDFAAFGATVIWAEDEFAGAKFDTPLHEAILDHVVANEHLYQHDVEELKQIVGRCAFLVQRRQVRENRVQLDALARDCGTQAAIAALNLQFS